MKRQKTTSVSSRASDYSSEGMYVFDRYKKIMMCKLCNIRVDWEKKSVVDNHCSSATHKKNREQTKSKKRQTSLSDSFEGARKAKEDRECFIKSTVGAFLKSNILLHKLDNPEMRAWMTKYIPGGGDLPKARFIRQKYVPALIEDYDSKVKEGLRGKKVVILSDESTNKKGEAVLVVLFKVLPSSDNPHPTLIVAGVKVLTACNADQCSKAIIQTITYFDVAHEDVVGIASDSAAYMTLCVRLLRELVNPDIVHIQCWAHKLDKVAKVFSDKLYRLNECVSKAKKLFKNTKKRKNRYLKYLSDTYSFSKAKEPKLFPIPVMTRWGSWRRSVEYVSVYVEDIAAYSKKIPASETVKSVEYFTKLTDEDIKIITAEAVFVIEYCTPVSELLTLVEGSKDPFSHKLYSRVNELCKLFSIVESANDVKTVITEKTKDSLNTLSRPKRKNLEERIKLVSKKCHELLTGFMSADSASCFFQATQMLFDPVKMVVASHDIRELKEKIALLSKIPTANFCVLHSLMSDQVKEAVESSNARVREGDIVWNVLLGMKPTHPEFVTLCMQVLHIPVSNVDSERAFSAYGNIVSPNRCRLSADNTEIMMCMYFGDGDGCDDLVEHSGISKNVNIRMSQMDDMDPDDPPVPALAL